MNLLASLPWYDLPGIESSLDLFWQSIRQELQNREPIYSELIPPELERSKPLNELWMSPDLILSQCCGPDLFTPQAVGLKPIALPVFAALDCQPGNYYSQIVTASKKIPQYPRLVINNLTSRSGCLALLEWLDNQGIKATSMQVSGSHQQSLEWLQNDQADLAAIDAQSWLFLSTDKFSIIGRSKPAPAPPFVAHQQNPLKFGDLYSALESAIDKAGKEIGISTILPANRELYRPLVEQLRLSSPIKRHSDHIANLLCT